MLNNNNQLKLTPFLGSSDYHLVQFCISSQRHLNCTMSSRSKGSASPYLLEIFPEEILGQIYLYSENPSFAVVNKRISRILSSQFIRVGFCIRIFFGYCHSPYGNPEAFRIRKRAQNLVLRQPWFSNNFARKLQREVLRRKKAQRGRVNRLRYHRSRRVYLELLTRIPKELLLRKPWSPAKVKLIHRLLQWGAAIPKRPKHIADNAMMNAIVENKYLAVNLLHNYCQVRFIHQHFLAAVLGDCDKRIVEMIIGFNNSQPQPFINRYDHRIYEKAKLLDEAGNPLGRQLLKHVLWRGFE